MPANLPPDYYAAEARYREAVTNAEKIACLEEMLQIMPKHKGTDHLKADLRKRISKLKNAAQTKKSVSRRDTTFQVPREGAGQVMVAGPANVGKSSLVSALTNARVEVSEAPFTTWEPCTGMMPFRDIQIQLVDTPALNPDFVEPVMMETMRRCDLILLMVDLGTDPDIQYRDALALLEKQRIVPRTHDIQADETGRTAFLPFLVLANKNDDSASDENLEIFRDLAEVTQPLLGISATTGRHLDELKDALFKCLEIMRVYSKSPGKAADMTEPFVLKKGSDVQAFANKVHKDFVANLKIARVWGKSVFDGQPVQRTHVLHDGDVVELHI
jgi:ribosome-interacting GTPase 1